MDQSRIAVTGTNGFVGHNLLHLLHEHYTFFRLNRAELKIIPSNLLDNCSTIIHLAGKAHDLKKSSNPQEYYEVNFDLTRNLYNAFLNSAAKKFIFISSVKAVVDQVAETLTEDTIPNPETHYGKSKLLAEQYIQTQPLPKGKAYYILRPCMIHGLGNKGNLNLLHQLVKRGLPYPLASFQNKRSFLSVQNLCFIIKELIDQKDVESGIYNVADDQALSTSEVVSILASSMNKKTYLWNISPDLITVIAKIGDKLHLPLTTERLSKLTENYIVSNAKIKAAINKQLPLSVRDGLQVTAASFSKL